MSCVRLSNVSKVIICKRLESVAIVLCRDPENFLSFERAENSGHRFLVLSAGHGVGELVDSVVVVGAVDSVETARSYCFSCWHSLWKGNLL